MKLRKLIILALVLLASLATAGTALAIDRTQAMGIALSRAEWWSTCWNNGWQCNYAFYNQINGPYGGVVQWEIIVTVVRTRPGQDQYCQWNVALEDSGATFNHYGQCRSTGGGF